VTTSANQVEEMRGLHAGAIVLAGVIAVNVGNYLFHLLSARELGPASYSDVVSLLALAGLIGLPLGGVQVVVARTVARLAAAGDEPGLRAFFRLGLVATGVVSVAVALAVAILAPVIQEWLGIGSLAAIVVTGALTIPALLTPIALGVAQGLQRFTLLSISLAASTTVRLATLVFVLALGFGVTAVLAASLVGSLVALAVPLARLDDRLRGPRSIRPKLSRQALSTSLLPVVIGLLAITALTTADVIVAKAVFDDHEAGIYGSASLVGRVILYLPAAIVTVLLPKVAARSTRGEASGDILAASIGVTVAASALLTLAYAVLPNTVVRLAFGSAFDDAAGLLGLFGIAMSGYALLNVLLIYHLARNATAMSWLLLAGAAAQLGGYALLHDTPRQLLAISISTMVALVVAHEVFIERSLTSAVAKLARF
jgi:O-antigen/teichoic acid export membrane protein